MAKFSTEAKVGLVVLVAIGFLTYMTFRVGGYRFGREDGYRIYALFDSAAGVDLKTPVKIAGVPVGEVERIDLSDTKARLTLRIRPEVKIRKGAQTVVRSSGLLGEKYIEILYPEGEETGTIDESPPPAGPSSRWIPPGRWEPWTALLRSFGPASAYAAEAAEPAAAAPPPAPKEPFVKEGEVIRQKGKTADTDQLINQLNAIADDLKTVSKTLKEALGTKEGERSLKEIIENIREITKNLNTVSKALKEKGTDALKNVDEISAKINRGEGTLGKLVNESELYDRLNAVLADVKEITEKVKRGEGTIGKLVTDEEAYKNLNTALGGLSSALGRIERFRTFVSFRNEFQIVPDENKGYFSLELSPRPERSYLLEVADDPRGKVTRTEKTETVGAVTTTTTTLVSERKLRFSAEFVQRSGPLALRIGMIESTAGIGADLYGPGDRAILSFDAWDFGSDDPLMPHAHLKATARYSLLRYIFLQAGVDNPLNKAVRTSFVGAGLRFEDNDLKYLLGSLRLP